MMPEGLFGGSFHIRPEIDFNAVADMKVTYRSDHGYLPVALRSPVIYPLPFPAAGCMNADVPADACFEETVFTERWEEELNDFHRGGAQKK
jgi:hypothetical protein